MHFHRAARRESRESQTDSALAVVIAFRYLYAITFLPETCWLMTAIQLPVFAAGRPAAQVDASLRQSLAACDRARECAVLWFAEVQRRALYRELGHPSLQVYATEALGFSPNRYWQFKRLADDLDRLPVLREAVETGDVGWTKAQQVARVATPATQELWVGKAVATGRRELEREVRQARCQLRRRKCGGAVVEAIPDVTITLRADSLQLARFEALVEKVRKLKRAPADADRMDLVLAGLEALVANEAEGPVASAPPVQVVVHQCPDCGEAAAITSRGEQRLAPAQVEALACDARVLEPGKPNRATIPPSTRAKVLARDRHRCTTSGCGTTRFLEVHHVVARADGGGNDMENLVTLCSRCHRHRHEHGSALAPAQVRQGG
jgi:5-methylcytosine-specific restriction endonuclease McrA